MKKRLLGVLLFIMALALAACGGGNDASNAADGDPINGIWKDGERSLVVDGIVGYYETGSGYVYGCDVNLNKQTITMTDYSWNDTNPEYSYEFISDKLVLETKNSEAIDSTFTFELSDQKLIDSADMQFEGKWYVGDKVLSIDGEKGLLENDINSYKCGIDSENKTITINKYSWNDSDTSYKYQIINGKLLLWSDNKEAFDKSLLFYTKEEFDALPKDDSSDEEEDLEDVDVENDEVDADEEVNADEEVDESSGTVFSPQDVSDKTIESIRTYGDYLIMYKKIIDDYFANYESAVKGTVLYSEESFQQMKDGLDEGFKEQEEQYGSMKNQKIVGKDDLVQFLKDYRDELKEYTDSIKESLG